MQCQHKHETSRFIQLYEIYNNDVTQTEVYLCSFVCFDVKIYEELKAEAG